MNSLCRLLSLGAPVWIRTYRLNKAIRILRRFKEILPSLETLPPHAKLQFSRLIQNIEGCEEIVRTKQTGLKGFLDDRGGRKVANWYDELQTDCRDMQLSLKKIERTERSRILVGFMRSIEKAEDESQARMFKKLQELIDVSSVRQTSDEQRLAHLNIISRELTLEPLSSDLNSYISTLKILEFLEVIRYDHIDTVLFGGASTEIRGKR